MFAGCRCPRCHDAVLRVEKREGRDALTCPGCRGAFVGADIGLRLLAIVRADVPPKADETEPSCPVCRAAMRRVTTPVAGIDVHACVRHGVWFDGDDLLPLTRAAAKALGKKLPELDAMLDKRSEQSRDPCTPASMKEGPPSRPADYSIRADIEAELVYLPYLPLDLMLGLFD